MKIITIANNKGGVGKTTTVANVAASMARRGHKVLAIDLDSQANLTDSLLGDRKVDQSTWEAIKQCKLLPITHVATNLDLVAADVDMTNVDGLLEKNKQGVLYLSSLIKLTGDKGKYKYVLIDTAPHLSKTMLAAIHVADAIYITVSAEMLAVNGLDRLEYAIENQGSQISGIILTRYEGRRINKTLREALQARYADRLFNTAIRNNIAIVEASAHCKTVYDFRPNSNGTSDYEALTSEILDKLK